MIRLLFLGLCVVSSLFLNGCLYSTQSTEVGVRTKTFSLFGKSGVENKVYAPGSTYFFVPFLNQWNTFDKTLQNIEMTLTEGRGDVLGRDDLKFKTIDGNDISLDVIISYRLDPELAPHVLQYVANSDEALRYKIVRIVARSLPRDIFGELTTEDFYNATFRAEKSEKARQKLNTILNPMGVVIEKVLTKSYRFNDAYQKAIEDKKVADQKREQFKSAINAKREEYNRKLEQTQGEVNRMIAKADGEYTQATIEADAYYEKQTLLSDAIRAEGEADAEGIRQMNKALAEQGGKVMVKLRLAEALKGTPIYMLPGGSQSGLDLRTLDMNEVLKIKGVQQVKADAKP